MKASTAYAAVLSIAVLSQGAFAAVTMNIARSRNPSSLSRRDISSRATITQSLVNNVTGGSYYVMVDVGTPGQQQTLAIDTGSSDVWVLDVSADVCTNATIWAEAENGCISTYDPSKSSSYSNTGARFNITYADGTSSLGNYIKDNLEIGGATIKSQEMGLGYNASQFTGLLGIGYDTNEASNNPEDDEDSFIYPSLIDSMVSQGLISTKAYSLYLDDLEASTGSIVFGGLDTDKYSGSLLQLPIIPAVLDNGTQVYAEFAVAWTSFSVTGQAGNTTNLTESDFKEAVLLDSGTTLTYVPQDLAESVYQFLGAIDDTEEGGSGLVFVDCGLAKSASKTTLNFGFGGMSGIEIQVPINELLFPPNDVLDVAEDLPFANTCYLGLNGLEQEDGEEEFYILGDTFLRSAYVVYDLTNNVIGIGQTNFNSTTSNIIDFQANLTAIPDVSGTASSAITTETATGAIGESRSIGSSTPLTSATVVTTTVTGTAGASSGIDSATSAMDVTKTATSVVGATGGIDSTSVTGATSTSMSSSSKSAAMLKVPAFDATGSIVLALSASLALLGSGLLLR